MQIRKSLTEYETELDGANFKLRQLSEVELEEVNYYFIDSIKAGHTVLPPKAVKLCLQYALLNWSGVKGEDGFDLKYEKGQEDYLPFKARNILASEIFVRSQMSEEEKKS